MKGGYLYPDTKYGLGVDFGLKTGFFPRKK